MSYKFPSMALYGTSVRPDGLRHNARAHRYSPPLPPPPPPPVGTKPRKKRRTNANASPPKAQDLLPPPLSGDDDSTVVRNPFDDTPLQKPMVHGGHQHYPHQIGGLPVCGMSSLTSMGSMVPLDSYSYSGMRNRNLGQMGNSQISEPTANSMNSTISGPMSSRMNNMGHGSGIQSVVNMNIANQQMNNMSSITYPNQMGHMPPHQLTELSGINQKPMAGSTRKNYPFDQPTASSSQTPIYPCGVCYKEVHDNDQGVLCESGCNFWFHRKCSGLSEAAYMILIQEVCAKWACDKCLQSKT